jgi:hypothetical protein
MKSPPDAFPIQNGLKQGDALPPLLFSFALQCALKNVQKGLELNGTHQLLVYTGNINVLDKYINTIKKNMEALS